MTATERSTTRAAGLIDAVALVGAVVVLHQLGRGPLAVPSPRDPAAIRAWLLGTDPAAVGLAVVRLLALAVAYHLLVTTALVLAGHLVRWPGLVRWAQRATLPLFRGTVARAVGVLVSVSSLAATPLASAAAPTTRSEATMVVIDRQAPPAAPADHDAVQRRSGPPRDHSPDAPAPPPVAAEATVATFRRMPADAEVAVAPGPKSHLVVPGDHLWAIGEAVLATRLGRPPTDAEVDPYWRRIVAANPQLADPDLLFAGEQVTIPPLP